MYGLPPEERERLNKMAAAAITDAAFKEQVREGHLLHMWPIAAQTVRMDVGFS